MRELFSRANMTNTNLSVLSDTPQGMRGDRFFIAYISCMSHEVWLPVLNYEGSYEVSSHGRVRSLDRINSRGFRLKGKMLKLCLAGGYPVVGLCRDGRAHTRKVAHLVLEAHGPGSRPLELGALHENDVKTDNRVENLRYGTHGENMQDCVRNGHHVFANREACPCGRPYDKVSKEGRRICSHCVREKARAKRRVLPCPSCGGPRNDVLIRRDGIEYYYCAVCRDRQMERAREAKAGIEPWNSSKTHCKNKHPLVDKVRKRDGVVVQRWCPICTAAGARERKRERMFHA